MGRLVWVNAESTVMVERWVGHPWVNVATRPDSDAVWGPPARCEADAETAKALAVGAEAAKRAMAMHEDAELN